MHIMFFYTDGCPEENVAIEYLFPNGTVMGSLIALWPESNIGPQSMSCPCGNIVPSQRTYRECRGDFITQAVWGESNSMECEMLDFNLCLIAGVR